MALSKVDPAACLKPAGNVEVLVKTSLQAFNSVDTSAKALLTKSAKDLDAFRGPSGDEVVTMRQLITNCTGEYKELALTEIRLCEDLKGYGTILPSLLEMSISEILSIVQPMVDEYKKAVDNGKNERQARGEKIVMEIEEINGRIKDASENIDALVKQAESLEDSLAKETLGKLLADFLRKLFNLADDDEGASAQLATLLGVAVDTLLSSFEKLYKDRQKLQDTLNKVKALIISLKDIKAELIRLVAGTKAGIDADRDVVQVWAEVQKRLQDLTTYPDQSSNLTKEQKLIVAMAWDQMVKTATSAIGQLTGAVPAKPQRGGSTNGLSSATARTMPFPETRAQINAILMAARVGADEMLIDPKKYAVLSKLSQVPEVVHRLFTNAVPSDSEDPEVENQIKKFGVEDVKEKMEGLGSDHKAIVNSFQKILEMPFLQNLNIIDPLSQHSEEIDMRTLVQRYKTKYEQLQHKTVAVCQNFMSTSTLQLSLLPKVGIPNTESAKDPSNISIKDYAETMKPIVDGYKQDADDARRAHVDFLNEWKNAQINITSRIEECKAKAKLLKEQIEAKQKEYENETVWGVLKLIGGVICLVASYWVPLLAPVGISLMTTGIKQLIDRGQLSDAIKELQQQFDTANDTADKLGQLKAPMDTVTTKLQTVINIWNDINTNINDIQVITEVLFNQRTSAVIEKLWKIQFPHVSA
ncbi:hypothetical protein LTR84_008819 [Exophiala bonariae]|uniref:Uncharacterized protein n=1 Tax=Exophiala bonariae TaxID=1690606 RepID=A0AAV9MWF6_9EURO|nr:hypothetical protein LTR84_008819 [Exophiala bonariae]